MKKDEHFWYTVYDYLGKLQYIKEDGNQISDSQVSIIYPR